MVKSLIVLNVLVYMLQRSFDALVVASAITPLFLWILGSSAMHAAARIRRVRGHPYLPMLILFAYAEVVYQIPTSVAGLVFGGLGGGQGQRDGVLALAEWMRRRPAIDDGPRPRSPTPAPSFGC